MKNPFSTRGMSGKLREVACRFPLAVASIAAGTVLALLAVHGFEDVINYRWVLFLGFALTSSVAVALAFEERWPRVGTLLAGVAVAALWGVRCVFFPADIDDMSSAQGVELCVILGASFFSVFFAAYLRRDTDAQWWNFSTQTVVRLILGAVFAWIFFGGLSLACFAVSKLFGVDVPEEIFADLSILCFIVFAPLYVLAGVPSRADKHDPELYPAPVLKVLALYVLGSVMAVYALILYVYLLKIIVTWELPNGWVSWLVTILATGGLAMTLLLYPLRMKGGSRLVEFLSRWTGIIVVPLLALMTVGIARRIGDYGWTPNRAYILLLNLWFYAIYIYLFVVRSRRVKWIVISAVAVAVLSSVGPWSLARIIPRESIVEAGDDAVYEETDGEWFSSDNTIRENTTQSIAPGFDRFMKISWYGEDNADYANGTLKITRQGEDIVICLTAGEPREFRLPVRQAMNTKEIRGEDFLFIVDVFTAIKFEDTDTIRINKLDGYLFYN